MISQRRSIFLFLMATLFASALFPTPSLEAKVTLNTVYLVLNDEDVEMVTESNDDQLLVYIPVDIETNSEARVASNELGILARFESAMTIKADVSYDGEDPKDYYVVAVKGADGKYYAIGDEVAVSGSDQIRVDFTLGDIYNSAHSTLTLNQSADIQQTQALYLFTADEKPSGGFDTSGDYNDGVSFELGFSSVYDQSAMAPAITGVVKGDSKLTVQVDVSDASSAMSDSFYRLIAFKFSSPSEEVQPFGDAKTATDGEYEYGEEESQGEVKLKELTNGVTYNVGVAVMNKYRFVSNVSATVAATPQSVEAFLREKGCFLISAGFKTDHYIIDYFRHFRDQRLAPYPWGQRLIQWYNHWGFIYALKVYYSPSLSALIRLLSYGLYFLFTHALLALTLLGTAVSGTLFAFYLRKRRSLRAQLLG